MGAGGEEAVDFEDVSLLNARRLLRRVSRGRMLAVGGREDIKDSVWVEMRAFAFGVVC